MRGGVGVGDGGGAGLLVTGLGVGLVVWLVGLVGRGGRGVGELVAVPRVTFSEDAGTATGRTRKDSTALLCPEARVQVMLNGLSQVWPPSEVSRLK